MFEHRSRSRGLSGLFALAVAVCHANHAPLARALAVA